MSESGRLSANSEAHVPLVQLYKLIRQPVTIHFYWGSKIMGNLLQITPNRVLVLGDSVEEDVHGYSIRHLEQYLIPHNKDITKVCLLENCKCVPKEY